MAMKGIPTEVWMSLGDLRHHVPWEKSLLKGVGVVRGATNYHSH